MADIFIDGVPSSVYGAKLVTYSVGATSLTVNTFQSVTAAIRHLLSSSEGSRSLAVTLEVTDTTEQLATLKISRLTAALRGQHSIRIGDGYVYNAILTAMEDPEQELRNRFFVSYTFDAIKQGEECVVSFSEALSVYCDSTAKQTPCIFHILADRDILELSLFGMTIREMKAGDFFLIDGVQKIATRNGINAFEQITLVDGTDFPTLAPGWNAITMSETAAVTLHYSPIYI